MSDLMTAVEAAKYLRLTYLTICRLSRQGKVPASKVGGKWRFKKKVLDEILPQRGDATPKQILVVDDDPKICAALKEVISREGFPVITAGSGEDALVKVQKRRFDLIFLDLVLPGINGVEVLRAIRGAGLEPVVAIITGYGDELIAQEAMSMGPLVLIRKPFSIQDIRKVLSFIAGRRQSRQHLSGDEAAAKVATS